MNPEDLIKKHHLFALKIDITAVTFNISGVFITYTHSLREASESCTQLSLGSYLNLPGGRKKHYDELTCDDILKIIMEDILYNCKATIRELKNERSH